MKMKKKNYCTTAGISTSFRLFRMTAGSAVLTAISVCHKSGYTHFSSVYCS